jgi:hypothetical protein
VPLNDVFMSAKIARGHAFGVAPSHCINTRSQKPMHYQTLAQYRDGWHLYFDNACQYNMPGSQIYQDAESIQLQTLHTQ